MTRELLTIDAPKDVRWRRNAEGIQIVADPADLGDPYEGEAPGLAPGFGRFATAREIWGHNDLPAGMSWTEEGYLLCDPKALASTVQLYGEAVLGDWSLDDIADVASIGPRMHAIWKVDAHVGAGDGSYPGLTVGAKSQGSVSRFYLQHYLEPAGDPKLKALQTSDSGSVGVYMSDEAAFDPSWADRWIHAVNELVISNLSGPMPQPRTVFAPVAVGPQRINLYPDPSQPQDVALLEPITGDTWSEYRAYWDSMRDARLYCAFIKGDAPSFTLAGMRIG